MTQQFADDDQRYRLDARIATGGMGEVWRATDTTLGREVAVKLLKNEYADDPTFRTRFETEARHAASLHHPNIAAVYDVGEAGGRPYLVMELVDGQPLSALLQHGRPMDPVAVRELLAQAADGLGAAHAAGIVHRDVKPANLLVTPDRRVKVTDFGIARAAEGLGLTGTGEVMGTPQYLSPEQAQGQTSTPASDVYSLGVVAYECLAGERPYQHENAVATALAHVREPVPDLPDSIPADLAAVVRRSMAKLPQDRYADGRALAAALRDPATAATMVVPPAPGPVHAGPVPTTAIPVAREEQRRRSALWPVLAVLALVVVAILVFLLITQTGDDGSPSDEETSQSPTESSSAPSTPSEPTSETTTEDTSIVLNGGDYIGRPLEDVERELGQLGLRVDSQQVDNPGGKIPGDVSAVNPTGTVQRGDTITVSFWGPEPEPTPSDTATPTPSDSATPTPTDSTSPSS